MVKIMKIRKKIEVLLFWYVPAYIVAGLAAFVFASYAKQVVDPSWIFTYIVIPLGLIMKHLDNVIIAIWLYFFAKQLHQKQILWALFGLLANVFAVILFLGLYFYEKMNPDEVDEVNAVQPKRKLFIWSK
jgi:hypothetical protein